MSRKLTLATVAALAAVGAFAAASLGGEGRSRPDDFNRSFERIGLQPVDAPSASASAGAQVAKGKPKAKYFESQPMPVTGPGADFSASCPGGHKALSGYFLSTGAIVPDTSAISDGHATGLGVRVRESSPDRRPSHHRPGVREEAVRRAG